MDAMSDETALTTRRPPVGASPSFRPSDRVGRRPMALIATAATPVVVPVASWTTSRGGCGNALSARTAPLVADVLVSRTGTTMSVAVHVSAPPVVSFSVVSFARRETHRKDLADDGHNPDLETSVVGAGRPA